MQKNIFIAIVSILSVACGQSNNHEQVAENNAKKQLALGDSISNAMQNVLLQNVGAAIKKGGTDHAVDYCSFQAMSITDSIAQKYHSNIQRLSDINRNPKNSISKKEDKKAWVKIKSLKQHFLQKNTNGETYYYKPIFLAMPTCIKCHGTTNDIASSTLKIIQSKYPNDLATNYQLGDLRGMWKIKINEL